MFCKSFYLAVAYAATMGASAPIATNITGAIDTTNTTNSANITTRNESLGGTMYSFPDYCDAWDIFHTGGNEVILSAKCKREPWSEKEVCTFLDLGACYYWDHDTEAITQIPVNEYRSPFTDTCHDCKIDCGPHDHYRCSRMQCWCLQDGIYQPKRLDLWPYIDEPLGSLSCNGRQGSDCGDRPDLSVPGDVPH
ncbi:hypothetical protein F5Y04DRAFT_281691 [Hypomontagnella monticulosa]|nr:hypothetical protein F5Y04DRAFT_281691 [Hypomontagnella monticulosa]